MHYFCSINGLPLSQRWTYIHMHTCKGCRCTMQLLAALASRHWATIDTEGPLSALYLASMWPRLEQNHPCRGCLRMWHIRRTAQPWMSRTTDPMLPSGPSLPFSAKAPTSMAYDPGVKTDSMMPPALMSAARALALISIVKAQWGTISLYTCSQPRSLVSQPCRRRRSGQDRQCFVERSVSQSGKGRRIRGSIMSASQSTSCHAGSISTMKRVGRIDMGRPSSGCQNAASSAPAASWAQKQQPRIQGCKQESRAGVA
jgi:hypothetical protein